MKENYQRSLRILCTLFLFNCSLTQAQLTVMATGNFNVGGVSDNGIVSMHTSAGGIYKWDATNGVVTIGALTNGYPQAGRTVISKDGTRIASTITNGATNFNELATYNVANLSWANHGGLVPTGWDGSVSSTWGMNSLGDIVVGLGWLTAANGHAIKWTSEGGIVDLGSIVSGRSSRANAVNSDGTVIVGWQDQADGMRCGAKWINGVESFILDGTGANVGEAGDVSADGNTIIGSAVPNPYVWNSVSGLTYITHPNSSAFFRGGATGISGNGGVVVGFYRPFPGAPMAGEGFIWTPAGGRVNLNDYAASLGITTNGVIMSLPLAISQDGKKIAGTGRDASGQTVAFYLDLTQYLAVNENVNNENLLSIYPNPAKDNIYIKGKHKIEKAEIYNMVGQKLRTIPSVESQIDVSFLSKGNYVLHLFVKGEVSQSFKFIKQ